MANMLDYLRWRGDLPAQADGWNQIDALIMANMCYNHLPLIDESQRREPLSRLVPLKAPPPDGADKYTRQWHDLLVAMAGTPRFGGLLMRSQADVLDSQRSTQFAAVTADAPDGSVWVCFRGTDNTLIGWREDFAMGFESPVPAQTAALEYLTREAARPGGPIYVVGHSKGGNLAAYAVTQASESVQRRVVMAYNFDGPGLDEACAAQPGYSRMASRLRSFVPQGSVVGLLLTCQPDYTIVHSTGLGILQHDSFTWQLMGNQFEQAQRLTQGSELINKSLHDWLNSCTPQQRAVFVNTIFDALEATDMRQFRDMKKNLGASLKAIGAAMLQTDAGSMKVIGQLTGSLAKIGADNIKDLLRPGE